MTTRHLVDPDLAIVLEMMSSTILSRDALPIHRSALRAMIDGAPTPSDPNIVIEEITIPGDGSPDIPALLYRPANQASMLSAILHIHGGGYVVGEARMLSAVDAKLAADLGCVVLAPDYRLAPETTHPGPVEDCYATLKWLHTQSKRLGVDPDRIAVLGESAGGGLAAALCLLARDRNQYQICFQNLSAPMLDDRTCTAQTSPFAGEFAWTKEMNAFGWTSLLGCPPGGADVSPYAAAARAEDLSGLPPTFISVGALDLFLEENLEYARRLCRAGVPVELHVYPGAIHGYALAQTSRVAICAERDSTDALRRALASPAG